MMRQDECCCHTELIYVPMEVEVCVKQICHDAPPCPPPCPCRDEPTPPGPPIVWREGHPCRYTPERECR